MSGGNEFPLSLIVKAVDRATGPLQAITHKLEEFTKPIGKIGKTLHEFGEVSGLMRVGEAFKGVGEGVHKVGEKAFELVKELAVLGLEVGFVAFEFVKHFVEIGDELQKTSARLGLTVDGYASLQYAAQKAGISHEELTTALDKFNKELGLAHHNSGKLYGFLAVASPVLLRQVKGAKSSEEALDLMWKAMVKLKNPSDRAAFATAIFGKSAAKMGALVKDGVGGLEEQRAEFLRLAGSQTEFAENSEKLDELLIDAKAAFMGVGAAIAKELFPAVGELAKALREFLVENREGIAAWARKTGEAITAWVKSGGIQRLAAGFEAFIAKVQPIVDQLGGWPVVLAGIAAAITAGPLLGALASLAAAFGTLGLAMLATPLGWALALLALVAGAAAFALAKDEAVAQNQMKRNKALAYQRQALDNVTDAQKDLNEAMARSSATPEEIEWRADLLKTAKQDATTATTAASAAIHDTPNVGEGLLALIGNRPSTGAGAVVPRAATEQNKLVVDFNNAPKGTRVTQESGGDLDLKMGYALTP